MSQISGGGARSLLRSQRPDGLPQHDQAGVRIIGSHKGNYSGFNMIPKRGGLIFQWGLRRNLHQTMQRGWWVADPERDGQPASALVDRSDQRTLMDGSDSIYPDLVPLCTTEDNYRALVEAQQAESAEALNPTGNKFFSNDDDQLNRAGGASRFAMRGHGTSFYDGDRVTRQLTPNTGALSQE